VLLISDDLDEIYALCHRIAVMHAGRLTEARAPSQWTLEGIGLAMAGANLHAGAAGEGPRAA
jgi:simple sugar transport system ATP-binding protein